MSNVIELRLLDHCVHPMCYVMDIMTNLRQYYSNSHKITKREDISNPFRFEVLERQTLEVESIVEKNKYLTILFFNQLYTHLHTCQKSHPCGAEYAQKGLLNVYILTHTGEKPYKCDTCDAQFTE